MRFFFGFELPRRLPSPAKTSAACTRPSQQRLARPRCRRSRSCSEQQKKAKAKMKRLTLAREKAVEEETTGD